MEYPTIPNQSEGDYHNTVEMHCDATLAEAKTNFEILKTRLISVNQWHTFSDTIKAEFELLDSKTLDRSEELKVGNFIKIDIPGPGSPSGHGFDWTEIVAVQSDDNSECPFFAFTIKPCAYPDTDQDTIAHFYTGQASNTFIIRRMGTCIYAEIHGRNEIENTDDIPLLDVVRNKAVAIGSKYGFGKLNWLGFANALLAPFEP